MVNVYFLCPNSMNYISQLVDTGFGCMTYFSLDCLIKWYASILRPVLRDSHFSRDYPTSAIKQRKWPPVDTRIKYLDQSFPNVFQTCKTEADPVAK